MEARAVAIIALCTPGPCGPGAGDCCSHTFTPGCEDEACCKVVCEIDPYCCDNQWDSICAEAAVVFCTICDSEPCQTNLDCLPEEVCVGGYCVDRGCPLDCPAANQEPEACGDDTNGGCNSSPPIFTPAAYGGTFCGTAWAEHHRRDTDWYLVDHGGGVINATLTSQFDGVCFIVGGVSPGGEPCEPYVVGDIGCSDPCENISVATADMPPGPVVVFVGAHWCAGSGIYDGVPCGGANDYVLSITRAPCTGECQTVPDGVVDIVDFLTLLAQWGQVGTSCDFDGGGVSLTDFLVMHDHWGPCP
jgi:hypothetical protein